jgi:hypothetical protein
MLESQGWPEITEVPQRQPEWSYLGQHLEHLVFLKRSHCRSEVRAGELKKKKMGTDLP